MTAAHLLAAALLSTTAFSFPLPAQTAATPSGALATSTVMQPVNGELTDKLDSKTAKAGDRVVIKTKSAVRIADGVEIAKGSKLIAHITGVKPAGVGDANAQIALAFDRIELKNGQSFSMQGEIESLAAAGDESNNTSDAMGAAPSNGSAGRAAGDMYGSTPTITAPSQIANQSQAGSNGTIVRSSSGSSAGTIVARSGDLTIRTTAIPGLLLANHESRAAAAQISSILLGTQRDIHLEIGTRIVIGIASAAPSTSVGAN